MVFSPFTIALGSCGEPQAWDLGTGVVSNGCVDCATDTVGYPLTLYLAYTGAVCAAHATPFGMTLSSCTIGNPYAQAFLVVWVGLLSLSPRSAVPCRVLGCLSCGAGATCKQVLTLLANQVDRVVNHARPARRRRDCPAAGPTVMYGRVHRSCQATSRCDLEVG